MSEWATQRLGDLAVVVDCEHKTAPPAATGTEYGYSVGTPHIRGGRIDYGAAKRVTKETFDAWSRRAVLGKGDLILAREAPVGQVGRVDPERPTCLGQRTVLVRPLHDNIEDRYLHAYLLGHEAQRWMEDRSSGSTVAHLNVADVREIPVRVPPLDEQRRIAAVLGAFDDLIETNRALVVGAREQASRVYELASEDGTTVSFDDVADLVRDGVRVEDLTAGTPYVGLEHFGTEGAGLMDNGHAGSVDSNKSRFRAGDVLYGKLRPYFRKFDRPGFDGVCSTEIWVLRPKTGWGGGTVNAIVARQAFTDFAMAGSGGTRMPRADWNHVRSMPVEVPSAEVREGTERILDQLWQAQVQLRGEIADLTRTRDELLPLLMSGRVRAEDVEGMV